jgi:hypothetical protein
MFHQLHLIKGTPEPMNRIVSRLEDTAFPDSQQRLGEKAAGKSHEVMLSLAGLARSESPPVFH